LGASVTFKAARETTFSRRSTVPAFLICFLAAAAIGRTQSFETARGIDWDAVKTGDPIPASMPTSSSDDPLEAGFARQWIEHSMPTADLPRCSSTGRDSTPEAVCLRSLALVIMSRHRSPDDQWAYAMESELRALIKEKFGGREPPISRVFCNAVGCLCYVQRGADGQPLAQMAIVHELLGTTGQELGLKASDLNATAQLYHGENWELTVVKRPSAVVRKGGSSP
jgi:hypothetical protein